MRYTTTDGKTYVFVDDCPCHKTTVAHPPIKYGVKKNITCSPWTFRGWRKPKIEIHPYNIHLWTIWLGVAQGWAVRN